MQQETRSASQDEQTGDTNQAASFAAIVSDDALVKSLASQGYHQPTNIQRRAVPALVGGRDAILVAARGSGKTLAYAIATTVSGRAREGKVVVISGSADHAKRAQEKFALVGIQAQILCDEAPSANVVIGQVDQVLPALQEGVIAPASVTTVVLDELGDALAPHTMSSADTILQLLDEAGANPQTIVVGKAMSFTLAGLTRRHLENPEQIDATSDGESGAEATHNYYEVGGDLMAKPNVLGDIIEVEAAATIVVFCNSPSDADFVEVMLKKRSIASRKLIGNIPPFKVARALDEVRSGEVRVLIVTDVSAKTLEIEDFDLVLNYSIPSDPEVYIHRLGRSGRGGKQHRIISLVGPLDITNFHYLKKFVEFEFVKSDPPGRESLGALQLKSLEQKAIQSNLGSDEQMRTMVEFVLESEHRDALVAYLLHQTLTAQSKGSHESRRGDQQGRRNRRGRDEQQHEQGGEEYAAEQSGRSRRRRGGRDAHEEGAEPRVREERAPAPPPRRSVRMYVGVGAKGGFSEQEMLRMMEEAGLPKEHLTRVQIRPAYAFADFPEEVASDVSEKLANATLSNGQKLLLERATLLNEPRQEISEQAVPAELLGEHAANGANGANEEGEAAEQEAAQPQ